MVEPKVTGGGVKLWPGDATIGYTKDDTDHRRPYLAEVLPDGEVRVSPIRPDLAEGLKLSLDAQRERNALARGVSTVMGWK